MRKCPLLVEGDDFQGVWLNLLANLLHDYDHTPAPRGFTTREITGVTLRINSLLNNILYHPIRNLNYRFMVAEFLWIATGREDLKTLTQYNGQMSRFSDDGIKLAGAYGPRLATQWRYVFESLTNDPVSRQAVATIWTPNPLKSKDIPCTISLQFINREGRLDTIATMRSSDIWLGLPYDVYTFSQLGNALAGMLKLQPGYLQMQLGSSHIYADNFEKGEAVLEDKEYHGYTSDTLPGWPPEVLEMILNDPILRPGPQLEKEWQGLGSALNAPTWRTALYALTGDQAFAK